MRGTEMEEQVVICATNIASKTMEKISWTDRVNNEAVLQSKGGNEHSSHNKTKEGQLDWAHIA
jgi:hypothetical protein